MKETLVQQFTDIRASVEKILQLEGSLSRRDIKRSQFDQAVVAPAQTAAGEAPTLARNYLKALGSKAEANLTEAWIASLQAHPDIPVDPTWSSLRLEEPQIELRDFPSGSWLLRTPFRLRKPYISKDDAEMYVIDNPVRKEWVFRYPYIAATQWKGTLRSGVTHELADQASTPDPSAPDGRRMLLSAVEFARRRFDLTLLFGDEKGELEDQDEAVARYLNKAHPDAVSEYRRMVQEYFSQGQSEPLPHHSGRLSFYASFFHKSGVEVINPHSRETGAGDRPIYFECVPIDATARFTLLYVPFDSVMTPQLTREMAGMNDLAKVAEAVYRMMVYEGFGAKTSSGFGLAFDALPGEQKGELAIKIGKETIDLDFSRLTEMVKKAKALRRQFQTIHPTH